LVKDLLSASPRLLELIDQISEQILSNRYYQALKLAGKLIEYEQEVLTRVSKPV
jgi:flagellar biosynthesis regulator FlbT